MVPAVAMMRGEVCLSAMLNLPNWIRLLRPSVRNTTLEGTWSDSPRRFAAYAPAGCNRVLALQSTRSVILWSSGFVA